jgi:hypothetical protein
MDGPIHLTPEDMAKTVNGLFNSALFLICFLALGGLLIKILIPSPPTGEKLKEAMKKVQEQIDERARLRAEEQERLKNRTAGQRHREKWQELYIFCALFLVFVIVQTIRALLAY